MLHQFVNKPTTADAEVNRKRYESKRAAEIAGTPVRDWVQWDCALQPAQYARRMRVAQQTLGGPGASPHVQGTRVVSASGTIDAVVAAARIVLERIYGA